MFISVLNWDLSLLVKRTRVEGETTSTPDLVNLANQLAHTLDESPKRKTSKILNFQLWKMKFSKWNQNFLVSAIIAKSQDIGNEIVTNLGFQTSSVFLTSLSNSQWWGSKELHRLFPILCLNLLRETTLQTGNEPLSALIFYLFILMFTYFSFLSFF